MVEVQENRVAAGGRAPRHRVGYEPAHPALFLLRVLNSIRIRALLPDIGVVFPDTGVMDSRARPSHIRLLFHLALLLDWGYNREVPKRNSPNCSTCGHLKVLHGSDWGCRAGHSEIHGGVKRVVVCSCQREFPQERKQAA